MLSRHLRAHNLNVSEMRLLFSLRCADPGIFVRGRGGRPNCPNNVFSPQLILQFYRGGPTFSSGGVQTKFADDTSLYIIVDDPLNAAIKLNAELSRIDMWASMWLVTFNPSKSESLIFPRKVNKPYHPPIYMNYQHVTQYVN